MFDRSKKEYEINRSFSNAVINFDLKKLEELIVSEGAKAIDVNGFFNETPFILYAAQNKQWDIVSFLYDNNANLDAKNILGWSLVHECVKYAPDYVFKAIIEYADVNVQTKKGVSPMMLAIKENSERASFLLDNAPITLELMDNDGNNLAHYAAKKCDYDLLLRLLEKGVLINLKNIHGETAVDLIEDISFKENLPKMAAIIGKQKNEAPDFSKLLAEDNEVKEVKRVVSGLSEIKRVTF